MKKSSLLAVLAFSGSFVFAGCNPDSALFGYATTAQAAQLCDYTINLSCEPLKIDRSKDFSYPIEFRVPLSNDKSVNLSLEQLGHPSAGTDPLVKGEDHKTVTLFLSKDQLSQFDSGPAEILVTVYTGQYGIAGYILPIELSPIQAPIE